MSADMTLSPLISVQELQHKIETVKHLVILDARYDLMNESYGDQAYRESRIPTALRVDLSEDLCDDITPTTGRHPMKSRVELEALFQDLGIHNDSDIVVYDDAGSMFAIHLWWLIRWLGHANVQVLEGGFKAWQAAQLPLESSPPVMMIGEGNFTAQESEFSTVNVDDIMADITTDHGALCIVDARGNARYRGDVEPLDPVAGHIPTAINRPFEANLTPEGMFKSPETLKREWLDFLEGRDHQRIVHQCGSGISACHNIFAMYYAGLGVTTLYPGSWSEWCKNPERPVVKGSSAK